MWTFQGVRRMSPPDTARMLASTHWGQKFQACMDFPQSFHIRMSSNQDWWRQEDHFLVDKCTQVDKPRCHAQCWNPLDSKHQGDMTKGTPLRIRVQVPKTLRHPSTRFGKDRLPAVGMRSSHLDPRWKLLVRSSIQEGSVQWRTRGLALNKHSRRGRESAWISRSPRKQIQEDTACIASTRIRPDIFLVDSCEQMRFRLQDNMRQGGRAKWQ